MPQIPIRVNGTGFRGRMVKPEVQASFVRTTHIALRDAVRFATAHSTKAKGKEFDFLAPAWDLEQAPWEESDGGDTLLIFLLPRLKDAVPRLFEQDGLFEEDQIDPDWTAFDLLGQIVTRVNRESEHPIPIDSQMLVSLGAFRTPIRKGLLSAKFEFCGSRTEVAIIDSRLTERATGILSGVPVSRLIRVVGILDKVGMDNQLFRIVTEKSSSVRGIFSPGIASPDELLGREVCVEGMASYGPNGELESLEATAIREATPEEFPFRIVSKLTTPSLQLGSITSPSSGFDKIVDQWPGDESDEEIRFWIREIS